MSNIKSAVDEIMEELEILGHDMTVIDKPEIYKVAELYGYIPNSVMRVKDNKFLASIANDEIAEGTYTKKMDAAQRANAKLKGTKAKQSLNNGLSKFNPALAKRLMEFYTKPGDLVLDNFSNRMVTTIIPAHFGRRGVMYEIVPSYAEQCQKHLDELNRRGSKGLIKKHYDVTIYNGNANNMHHLEDNSVDFCMSSPPFANREAYESVDGQLSDIENYEDFLVEYQLCLNELYRVMKPGAFVCYIVNDWRANGKFIRFSMDTELGLRKAGFESWDIVINYLHSTPSVIGINKSVEQKRFLKAHEYIVVMRKPLEE